MKPVTSQQNHEIGVAEQEYRELIERMAYAIATNNADAVIPEIDSQFDARHVDLFVDGNFNKRIDVFLRLMPFVSEDEDFGDMEELAETFALDVPVKAYDDANDECDDFLAWMQENVELSARQRDTIACQRARYSVERIARTRRLEHVRFQELASVSTQLFGKIQGESELTLHLNPCYLWAELMTEKYLSEGQTPPYSALFYAVDSEVRTALFDERGVKSLETLSQLAPCRFDEWNESTFDLERAELMTMLKNLVTLNVVAIS